MSDHGDWTAGWAAAKLRDSRQVRGVAVTGAGRLRIERNGLPPITVATLSVTPLDDQVLRRTIRAAPRPEFVLNIKSGASMTPEAMHLSRHEQVPVGRLSDLERALSMENVREYVDPETHFRERGFDQHTRVASYERLDLRRYFVERHGMSPLTVIFLDDYDLGAEAIRQARAEYGEFDIVVAINPNGRVTEGAAEVAAQLGCEALKWGPFLSRLNRER